MVRNEDNRRTHDMTPQEALQQADHLVWQGQFPQALEHLDQLEAQEDLPENVRLQSQLLRCRIFTFQDPKKAQDLATQVIQTSQDQNQPLIQVDALLLMAEVSFDLGFFDTSKTFVDQGKTRLATNSTIPSTELTKREATVLTLEGCIYTYKGELDRALECLQQSLVLREQQNDPPAIAQSFIHLGIVYMNQGEYQRALECFQQSLTLNEPLGHPPAIALSLFEIGILYEEQGELKRALDCLTQSLAICKQVGWRPMIAHVSNWLGCVYIHMGELNQAVELFQTSLGLCEQLEIPGTLVEAKAWQFLGMVYVQKGEWDRALEDLQQGLVLYEEQGYQEEIGTTLIVIGNVYLRKGQLKAAFEYLGQSLRIYEELGNERYIMYIHIYLIMLALERNQPENARRYLQRIEENREKAPSKVTECFYNLAWALLLKVSPRTRDKLRAQDLFRQLAEEEILNFDQTVLASLNLCELLIFEFKTSEDPEILHEIHTVTNRLLDSAKTQHAYSILAETYVLQAKLALVELDVSRARRLFTQAQAIADDKGLEKLARSISYDHDRLLSQLSQWEALMAQKAASAEARELSDIEDLLNNLVRQRAIEPPELQPEDPVLLLILAEGGLTLFSHLFKEEQQLNGHLIGGFLSALSAFGQDALAASGIIDRIMYQDYTVAAKARDVLMFYYIFQGQSYLALQKLEQFIDRVGESSDLWQTLTRATKTDAARKTVTESEALHHLIQKIFQS